MSKKVGIHPLFLIGEINETVVAEMINTLIRVEPCLLVMDSSGGNVRAGEALSGALRDNDHVTALVVGRVESMAIPVLQACAHRVALVSASFFFHSLKATRQMQALDMFDAAKVESLAADIREVQERYWHRILRRIEELPSKPEKELTQELLRHWCTNEVRLSAVEALSYGLVDEVKELPDILNVKALGF